LPNLPSNLTITSLFALPARVIALSPRIFVEKANRAAVNIKRAGLNIKRAGLKINRAAVKINRAGLNAKRAAANANRAGLNVKRAAVNVEHVVIAFCTQNNNTGTQNNNTGTQNGETGTETLISPRRTRRTTKFFSIRTRRNNEIDEICFVVLLFRMRKITTKGCPEGGEISITPGVSRGELPPKNPVSPNGAT
jgi:hypothetical protein